MQALVAQKKPLSFWLQTLNQSYACSDSFSTESHLNTCLPGGAMRPKKVLLSKLTYDCPVEADFQMEKWAQAFRAPEHAHTL